MSDDDRGARTGPDHGRDRRRRPQREAQGGRPLHPGRRAVHRGHRRCPGCCTSPSCAARSRTRASCRIDTSAAEQLPGVVAVVTGEALAAHGLAWMPTLSGDTQAVLATDKVRFQGQEVAGVVAESPYVA